MLKFRMLFAALLLAIALPATAHAAPPITLAAMHAADPAAPLVMAAQDSVPAAPSTPPATVPNAGLQMTIVGIISSALLWAIAHWQPGFAASATWIKYLSLYVSTLAFTLAWKHIFKSDVSADVTSAASVALQSLVSAFAAGIPFKLGTTKAAS